VSHGQPPIKVAKTEPFDNAVLCKTKEQELYSPALQSRPKTPELAQKSDNRKAEERKHCFFTRPP
jgi:hypothetical protein